MPTRSARVASKVGLRLYCNDPCSRARCGPRSAILADERIDLVESLARRHVFDSHESGDAASHGQMQLFRDVSSSIAPDRGATHLVWMRHREQLRMPEGPLAPSCPTGLAGSGGHQTVTPE